MLVLDVVSARQEARFWRVGGRGREPKLGTHRAGGGNPTEPLMASDLRPPKTTPLSRPRPNGADARTGNHPPHLRRHVPTAGVNCLNDVTALGGRLIAPRSWYYTHGLRTRRRLLALMPLLPPPGLEARARQCRLRGGGDEGRVAHCSIPYFVLHYLNYILYHSTCDMKVATLHKVARMTWV